MVEFQSTKTGEVFRPQLLHAVRWQVAGIVPYELAPGIYNVSVSYNGETSPQTTFVVAASAPGIFTVSMDGDGPGVIQSHESPFGAALNQLTKPALPGDSLTIWASGIGSGSTEGDDPNRVIVEVGGSLVAADDIQPAAGSPGVDLVRFRVPADAATGCYVPLRIGAGTAVSNSATVAISNTRGRCDHPLGFNVEQMSRLDAGGMLNFAELSIVRGQLPPDDPFLFGISQFAFASAEFYRADAVEVARKSAPPARVVRLGCRIEPGVDRFFGIGTFVIPIPSPPHIDYFSIGGDLILTNPERQPVVLVPGSVLAIFRGEGFYDTPSNTPWEYFTGGRWQFEHTAPGEVGPFRAQVDLAPAIPFEPPAVISSQAPTTFTWPTAGLNADQIATIRMDSNGRNPNEDFDRTIVSIECRVPAISGSITLPTDELRWYADRLNGKATLEFEVAEPQARRFSAPGLDYGAVTASHTVTRRVEVR